MELVKVGTKIKLTQEDRGALESVKDIFDEIWNEMRTDDYLLGYGEDTIQQIYYVLADFVDAEDDELTIKGE
jgi:hypothetical protein